MLSIPQKSFFRRLFSIPAYLSSSGKSTSTITLIITFFKFTPPSCLKIPSASPLYPQHVRFSHTASAGFILNIDPHGSVHKKRQDSLFSRLSCQSCDKLQFSMPILSVSINMIG